jgi:branched-chain amino acid transport system ATP-binding protein
MSTPIEVLRAEKLSGGYGLARVLFDVSLTVNQGEVVAIMGRNGAGKSTLLKALMGLLPNRQGQVLLWGQSIARWPTHRIAQAGLGFVPQDRRIFTDLSVAENLLIGRQPQRFWPDGSGGPVWTPEKLFDYFPNLASMRDRLAAHMSGGEQQMLSVARTLMGNPLVILLDEPSEGVAPIIVQQMLQMGLALKREGVSVLLSEQNLGFAQALSDRAYVLEQGHIRYEGSMQALAAETALCERYLGVAI